MEKALELVAEFWMLLLNIAGWILAGSWYEIMFKILGVTGSLFLVRQIHFEVSDENMELLPVTVAILALATIFWFLIAVAVVYLAFFQVEIK